MVSRQWETPCNSDILEVEGLSFILDLPGKIPQLLFSRSHQCATPNPWNPFDFIFTPISGFSVILPLMVGPCGSLYGTVLRLRTQFTPCQRVERAWESAFPIPPLPRGSSPPMTKTEDTSGGGI